MWVSEISKASYNSPKCIFLPSYIPFIHKIQPIIIFVVIQQTIKPEQLAIWPCLQIGMLKSDHLLTGQSKASCVGPCTTKSLTVTPWPQPFLPLITWSVGRMAMCCPKTMEQGAACAPSLCLSLDERRTQAAQELWSHWATYVPFLRWFWFHGKYFYISPWFQHF